MSRIFPPLALVAVILMLVAFGLGWVIDDPASMDPEQAKWVRWHLFAGVGALVFVCMVHSFVLTYFMGTGRWLEETSKAYSLTDEYYAQAKRTKYRSIMMMAGGILALVLTAAFGALADPASRSEFGGWFGFTAAQIHFGVAATALTLNLLIHFIEFQAVRQNGKIVEQVLADVHRIRTERGLPTEPRPESAEAST